MWLAILGPIDARHGDAVLVPPAAKQRVVLAALLLRAGHPVSYDELAETIWDGQPPASARVTVRNYVKRLRQSLGPVIGARVVTRYPGYVIEASADEVDVLAFERLYRDGCTAGQAGAWQRASALLTEALALWRGTPLQDIPSERLQREHVPRLGQMRLHALEERLSADLHLGRHYQVLDELHELAAAEPLRERVHAHLILALYRSGRQAEALVAYQRVRDFLIEELGVEPGHDLRQLHQRILAGEPGLMLPAPEHRAPQHPAPQSPAPQHPAPQHPAPQSPAPEPGACPVPLIPRQLPADMRHFTGRQDEMVTLSGLLEQARSENSVVFFTVSGTAGVGKTALAVHWAHQVADEFPDGHLFVNLRGFDPADEPMTPADAIRGFLDALQVPAGRIPVSLEAQAGLYRTLLTGRRVLIVLDNARDAAQVRPLLPGSPGSLVIVTSRDQMTGLVACHGAHPVPVGVLSDADGHELLSRRLGPDRVAAEPDSASEIVSLCARLPLALNVIAARAAASPRMSLEMLAGELRDITGRLDALDSGDAASSVRAAFASSRKNLPGTAARMFGLLGVHVAPEITVAAAASLAGVPSDQARQALRELARAQLITEAGPGRFALHDLLRAYAAEQAGAGETDSQRRAALRRILDHYLQSGYAAAYLIYPPRDEIVLLASAPGVLPEQLSHYEEALAWFQAEQEALVAAAGQAAGAGFDGHAWQLSWALAPFLIRSGHWQMLVATQRAALAAAERGSDLAGQAWAHRYLGQASIRLSELEDAETHLRRAIVLHEQRGDVAGQASETHSLGYLFEQQGQFHKALAESRRSLDLYRRAGHRAGEARALGSTGWCLAQTGDYAAALDHCQRALPMHPACDELGSGDTWDTLGYIHLRRGDHDQSIVCFQKALDLFAAVGHQHVLATGFVHLGDAQAAAGQRDAAREAWQRALTIFLELRDAQAGAVRRRIGALADA
jgi:DNA-binding SARP family transcriptional activator/tetratricopeptide (TPR) repeat protein